MSAPSEASRQIVMAIFQRHAWCLGDPPGHPCRLTDEMAAALDAATAGRGPTLRAVHVAGPLAGVTQRCRRCSRILVDYTDTMVPEDGTPPRGGFALDAWVEEAGPTMLAVVTMVDYVENRWCDPAGEPPTRRGVWERLRRALGRGREGGAG